MATKDKLINLEDLKVLSDHVEGEVTDLKSDLNLDLNEIVVQDRSINLFNKNDSDIVDNAYLNSSGIQTPLNNVFITEYIRVNPGDEYTSEYTQNFPIDSQVFAYDKNKVFKTTLTPTLTSTLISMEIPYGIFFIRLNRSTAKKSTTMVVRGNATAYPSEYIAYRNDDTFAKGINLSDSMKEEVDDDIEQMIGELVIHTKSVNLFNPNDSDVITGKYIDISGNLIEASGQMVSGFIPVTSGKSYTRLYNPNLPTDYCGCYYNSSKEFVSNASYTKDGNFGIIASVPNNVAFIRLNIPLTYRFTQMFVEGSTSDYPSEYVAYVDKKELADDIGLNDLQKEQASELVNDNPWHGKIWHGFGTSITNTNSEGKYPIYLSEISGMTFINHGYSGGCIASGSGVANSQIISQIDAATLTNADLVTVEGFVNDWSQNVPIGDITDTETTTLCGAIYQGITKLLAKTNALIVFITDSTGTLYNSTDLRRSVIRAGGTQNDFIEATIKMCHYMNIPVIDAGRKSMISQDTATLYITDQIHHTEKGGEQYAQTIWAELKNIMPRIT